tara:strand:+ start:399 stop:1280 length:882 start_codon:yes stop_codon:yes gene_type:complete
MALKYLVDLDLGGNEIQNFALQTLATAPANGFVGQVYYDTAASSVFVHTGTAWARVGLSADGTTITESGGQISVGAIPISSVTGLATDLATRLTSADIANFATTTYADDAAAAVNSRIDNDVIPALDLKADVTYVDAAVAAVVDAAPAALDTLNELAAALGDDENFATTVSTSIGTKLNSADYTAADVLAKLLTVDGAASGLDADKLDGQSSAYYRNYNNLTNTPTILSLVNNTIIGAGANTDLGINVAAFLPIQIYELTTGNLVITDITQDGVGAATAFLNSGVQYVVVSVA